MKKVLFVLLALFPFACACGNVSGNFSEETILTEEGLCVSDDTLSMPSKDITVAVLGAVENPGIFIMPENARVYEAINAAGGTVGEADLTGLNLAATLSDGEQIVVETDSKMNDTVGISDGKININTASVEELKTLTGIGAKRAEDIISYREKNGRFSSPEDIMKVSGIKNGTFEKIKDCIVAR